MTEDEDERLAAWLDGALPPGEAQAFAAALDADPALAAKAEAWRANDKALAGAFFASERPIDDALIARLGLASAPAAANDNPRRPRLGWLAAGSALAASLVVAVSVLASHIHYAFDVVGAWAITFAIFALREGWPRTRGAAGRDG